MARRRDDIVAEERAQIAIEMMSPDRSRGRVQQLAETYRLSRQTLYEIAAKGKTALEEGMKPGCHGPQGGSKTVLVTKNRVSRGRVDLDGERGQPTAGDSVSGRAVGHIGVAGVGQR